MLFDFGQKRSKKLINSIDKEKKSDIIKVRKGQNIKKWALRPRTISILYS